MVSLKNIIGRIFGVRDTGSIFEPAIGAVSAPELEHCRLAQQRLVDGALDEAKTEFELALHLNSLCAAAHYGLADIALQQRKHHDAAQSYCAGLVAGGPTSPAIAAALELQTRHRAQDAVPIYRQLLDRDATSVDVLCNFALALRENAEYVEARSLLERALAIEPDNLVLKYNYATLLADLGELSQSVELYSGYLAHHPEDNGAYVTRGLVRLLNLDFASGWEDYEFRRESVECRRPFRFPEWDGAACRGRTLLVYGEQGLGDEIMFASCLPDVLRRADKVVLECEPRLASLFARSFPTVQVHARKSLGDTDWLREAGHIDYQIALGSLPRLFRRSLSDFPDHVGYLRADPARITYWREQLAMLPGGLKVGVSWRGGNELTRRNLRSLDLSQLEPLLRVENVSFVNLQYGNVATECAEVRAKLGTPIFQFEDAMKDYDETAALVCALDLVVSVQTSIVHLAGALGKPAWVMLPFSPEWRYMRSGDRMLWYPSVKLIRQPKPKDWGTVVDVVARQLDEHVARSP